MRWDVARVLRLAAALLGLAAICHLPGRGPDPAGLSLLPGKSRKQLAGRSAPDPRRPPALRGAGGRLRTGRYPPLYFATSAAVASVFGLSYLPLRLVSLVSSLVCFAVLARLVQRETASAAAGIAAAACWPQPISSWTPGLTSRRVDSLFLALSVAALYAARWMRRTRGAVATGLLLAAAFLTKQNGLAEGVAVLIALAAGPAAAAGLGRGADLRRGARRAARSCWGWPATAGTCTTSSSR